MKWHAPSLVIFMAISFNMFECGESFPRGAPSSACGSNLPSHGRAKPQPSRTSPFILQASRKYFDFREDGADRIVVNLTSSSGSEKFKGFVVAAYDASGKPYGVFDHSNHAHQIPRCDKPAMTQNNAHSKTHVSLVWRPPTGTALQWGWMQFKATALKSYKKFWVNIPFTAPDVVL